jgi:hypothetical protein
MDLFPHLVCAVRYLSGLLILLGTLDSGTEVTMVSQPHFNRQIRVLPREGRNRHLGCEPDRSRRIEPSGNCVD